MNGTSLWHRCLHLSAPKQGGIEQKKSDAQISPLDLLVFFCHLGVGDTKSRKS